MLTENNIFIHDGHEYHYELNKHYGSSPNVEKMVVWDNDTNLIGDATIDHNMEQIQVDMVDDTPCTINYFEYEHGDVYDYDSLATTIVAIATS